ncbi:hypothetical protein GQ42DRAFT_160273 [Ramicandelaber brevisporus]|nr:hypothetical protein GQ42DRAFT_160273 [Ramicandelaber brevisporus]
MVSFVCNACQDIIKKPKLDQHAQRCRGANFSCVDCFTDFAGTSYRSHTSCMTEVQKYEQVNKGKQNKSTANGNTPAPTATPSPAPVPAPAAKTEDSASAKRKRSEDDNEVKKDEKISPEPTSSNKDDSNDSQVSKKSKKDKKDKKEKKDKKDKKDKKKDKDGDDDDSNSKSGWSKKRIDPDFAVSLPLAVAYIHEKSDNKDEAVTFADLRERLVELYTKNKACTMSKDEIVKGIESHLKLNISSNGTVNV